MNVTVAERWSKAMDAAEMVQAQTVETIAASQAVQERVERILAQLRALLGPVSS